MFKESAIFNLLSFPVMIGIALLMAILMPRAMTNPGGYAAAALVLYAMGFVLFALAKIQNIRKGHLVSFGSSRMSAPCKWAYRLGYTLMGFAVFLTMVLLVIGKFNR
jgi:hypothetical protein